MKARNLIWTYLFTLTAGVLLIVFSGNGSIFRSIVIALGVLFLVPSIVALVMSLLPAKDDSGARELKWYLVFTSALGVAFGIMLLAIPGFFVQWIVYTLAAILIFCGIAGIIFMRAGDLPGADGWLYTLPVLTLACGLIIIFIGPGTTERVIALISGIFLTVYSLNGFWAYFRRRSLGKRVEKAKEEAETEAARAADDVTSEVREVEENAEHKTDEKEDEKEDETPKEIERKEKE